MQDAASGQLVLRFTGEIMGNFESSAGALLAQLGFPALSHQSVKLETTVVASLHLSQEMFCSRQRM